MKSDFIHGAFYYAQMAVEVLTMFPIPLMAAVAAISAVCAGVTERPFHNRLWKPYHWLFLTHGLFFVAAIAVGLAWATDPASAYRNNPAGRFWLGVVLFGSLASCLFWIGQMKGFRGLATCLMVLFELVTLGAVVVAGMSVYGDWL